MCNALQSAMGLTTARRKERNPFRPNSEELSRVDFQVQLLDRGHRRGDTAPWSTVVGVDRQFGSLSSPHQAALGCAWHGAGVTQEELCDTNAL